MFIQTEATADPHVMKFYPGQTVLASGRAEFPDREAAGRSPLALELFAVDGVHSVALDDEYVTVSKGEDDDWQLLKPAVLCAIMDHFTSSQPVMLDGADTVGESGEESTGENAEVVAEIKELIDSRIKPAVAQSGDAVAYHSFVDGTVYLELSGNAISMLGAIQNMLTHYVPDVRAVADHRDALPKPGLDTPVGKAVARTLDEQINPSVASHGGHIALVDVIDDTVYIRLEGGCQGCGMADVTLKQGVETEIKRAVPEIREILDVTDHGGGSNPYYQPGKGGASPVP